MTEQRLRERIEHVDRIERRPVDLVGVALNELRALGDVELRGGGLACADHPDIGFDANPMCLRAQCADEAKLTDTGADIEHALTGPDVQQLDRTERDLDLGVQMVVRTHALTAWEHAIELLVRNRDPVP